MAGSQSFFPLRVDETISRVSLYEAYFVVRTGKICLFVALYHERTAHRAYTTGRQQNMQRARRYNAAAHKHQKATPCVCDKPIHMRCPAVATVVVFIGACGP